MKTAALLAVLASACACASAEHVHPSRIHLVDRSKSGNFLFRGNMPINATGFAYDEIKQVMAQRAHEAGVANFPEDVFVHVVRRAALVAIRVSSPAAADAGPAPPAAPPRAQVSFNNPFEMNDIDHELQFCRWYPSLCKVDIWLLVGNIVPPSVVPKELRKVRRRARPRVNASVHASGRAVVGMPRLTARDGAGSGRELRVGRGQAAPAHAGDEEDAGRHLRPAPRLLRALRGRVRPHGRVLRLVPPREHEFHDGGRVAGQHQGALLIGCDDGCRDGLRGGARGVVSGGLEST